MIMKSRSHKNVNTTVFAIIQLVVLQVFSVTAFADYRLSSSYFPSSTLDGNGVVSVGEFSYSPKGLGFNIDHNKFCASYSYLDYRMEEHREIFCSSDDEIVKTRFSNEYSQNIKEGSRYFF